ncbi:hypothetical protein E2C01_092838 [Portunus trituberculatus]|uniref:Uncharacterized protein n=1 Tax=Portunus trituberculatus TaxID=210409 RepID=A0A5B7JHH2_PORTR|nr:hypothetical protein [Portunus trituberculatus]
MEDIYFSFSAFLGHCGAAGVLLPGQVERPVSPAHHASNTEDATPPTPAPRTTPPRHPSPGNRRKTNSWLPGVMRPGVRGWEDEAWRVGAVGVGAARVNSTADDNFFVAARVSR